jgi:tetratricopeptide (TPR) repeat protein
LICKLSNLQIKIMKENAIKLSYTGIFILTLLVAVSAPLFFLPLTSEFFEFNKFTLLMFATIAGAILWSVRMVLQKRFAFTRTPLDIPLVVLLLVFFIAAISSIDQVIAIFGTPARPWPSFVSLLTLVVFYFVASSNIKSKKNVDILLYVLTGSTVIAALVSVTSYFGAFLPFQFAQYRAFNTLGSANSLALLEAIVIPLTASWVLFSKDKIVRGAAAAATVILAFSLILINFAPAYFGLVVGLLLVGAIVLKYGKISKPAQLSIGVVVILSVLLLAVRYIPSLATQTFGSMIVGKDKSLEINKALTLGQNYAWDIATSTIGKRPLFGTGPGTYLFTYTQLKPRAINNTDFWRIRFDKSSSDFTEIIATVGIIGVLAFLLFIAAAIRFIWSLLFKGSNSATYLPVSAMAVTFIASQFFATSTISTVIPFFIALAATVVLAKTQDEKHVHEVVIEVATLTSGFGWLPTGGKKVVSVKSDSNRKGSSRSQILPYIFLILVILVSIFGVRNQVMAWSGEYYYRQALLAAAQNNGSATINALQQAINTNPGVDTYHRDLSATALSAAITLSQQKNLSDSQKQLINQLAQVAVDQGKVASGYQILPLRVPGISASNVANWETVSAAYQALIGQLSGSDVNAVNTLLQAAALDPENPILHDKIGQIQKRLKNIDAAQRKFEDAVITKNDYGPAHYDLAILLIEKNGDVVTIAQELAAAKRFLPANDPAMSDINKRLAQYNKKVEDLQKAQNQAATQPSPTPDVNASPTPTPSSSPSPSPTLKPGL